MKFRFITILHNMKLDTIKNRGSKIFTGARISNGAQILDETLETDIMHYTLGSYSKSEFNDVVYFYMDGELKDIHSVSQMNEIGMQYTFFLLREAQFFTHALWEVKDNNVYVRDGFLLTYTQNFEDGVVYKASLSEVFTYSTGDQKESLFSESELLSAIQNFVPSEFDNFAEENFGGKLPDSKHLFKSGGSNRINRAEYFTVGARNCSIIPTKIVFYCTALECLFTIGSSEINHKIAERVALMLGTSEESKKNLFKFIKNAYDYRSKLIHGQHLKGNESNLVAISQRLDEILRELLRDKHEIFYQDDQKMETHFIKLLFA
ncbi:HEPN domain-containing protein [Oceanobacillus oncorhynchi]|uniref:HEPN domain-containing protein n=1 Tax=Oceanobacillus oncorhynchi TaxID=545501 RepID=UPI001867886B|nr:HEPN domain-containing protein [Oceanobacillus oncorhynchi]